MGKFVGLNDHEWAVVEPLIPYPWGIAVSGTQPMHPRKILNTLIWVLTTGARWCDAPTGEQWASKSCAHRYLGLWKENGILERVLAALQEVCLEWKMIDLTRLAIDGFFSAGKGGGEKVDHGYKGKGVTTHLLVDGLGQPLRTTSTGAAGDERQQVIPLIKKNRRLAKAPRGTRNNTDHGSR
jgi:transposase